MSTIDDQFPGSTLYDLRGKQSVRATFKLSQKAIDAIGLLAIHMGIKQKSLFDHIIQDMDALNNLAGTIRIAQFKKIPRRQKTFVLSRRTIEALETISKSHDTPRDALVEYSIKKLESIIRVEKARHKERKRIQDSIVTHFHQGKLLYQKAVRLLGENDPFCRRLEKAIHACQKSEDELTNFIERSKLLEDF